ncbi:MAG: carbon-nitrogen hydrolase family protein [Pirellulales bacterium]|nr:carbon-nitrogen hydrolase family protein [Pirellulales bacterium]
MRVLLCCLIFLGAACRPCAAAEVAPDAPRSIAVASLMLEPVKWDKDENERRLMVRIREARRQGAQLVVTPEGAIDGYVENEVIRAPGEQRRELVARFNALAEPCDGPRIGRFTKLCDELDVFLVLAFLERDGGFVHNSAILIDPAGAIVGKYRKTHFAQGHGIGDRKGDNPPGYLPGKEYPVFPLGSWKMGIMICYDRRVPEVAQRLAAGGAQFIVNPSFGMSGDCNRRYLSARAKETGVPILFVHPRQTVYCTAAGAIETDERIERGEARVCIVTIEPARGKGVIAAGVAK